MKSSHTVVAGLVILLGFYCSTASAQSAAAEASAQGRAAGAAANAAVRPNLSDAEVRAATPGYTATPPETASRGSVRSDAQARLAACQSTNQNDPSCQGVVAAHSSANTPRQGVSASDPDIAYTRTINASPGIVLGDLSEFYPGCTRFFFNDTATTEIRSCTRYEGVGAYACSNTLSVAIERTSNCTARTWYASATSGSTGLEIQCRPEATASSQHFRLTEAGRELTQFDVNMTTPVATPPSVLATAGTEYDPWVGPVPVSVYQTSKSCSGTTCSLGVVLAPPSRTWCDGGDAISCRTETPFSYVYSACPADSSDGSNFYPPQDVGTCYAQDFTGGGITVGVGDTWINISPVATRTILSWGINPAFGPVRSITLNYTPATTTVAQRDVWRDQCPTLAAGGRCSVATAPVCVDGPSTRVVDGISVTRQCWEYASSMNCSGSNVANQCETLSSSGCTQVSSSCSQTNASTGTCEIHRDQYSCPVAAGTSTTFSNCPRNVSCIGDSCFNTTRTPDPNFAQAISMLEAARQAGSHMDPYTMTVFNGEPNTCRDRALVNCCNSDPRGGTIIDSQYIEGSAYVYTLLTADGLGAFTAFGLTTLLLDRIAGCSDDETRLALKEGARLCHHVGEWCSSCVRVFGRCVSCITHTHMKCCFNSILARVINQQGRAQIGKGWGSPESPDCSGFTVAQLQTLNFATMDLSEFYASIVANPPDLSAIQERNLSRIGECYYGQGRCGQ